MNIIINGDTRDFKAGVSVLDVIEKLSLDGKVMAAAVNMDIVKQKDWSEYKLKESDKLELLDFVGGG